jgi:hypothetical protein
VLSIYVRKREVAQGRRKLLNGDTRNLFSSLSVVRVMATWMGHVARMRDEKCIQ